MALADELLDSISEEQFAEYMLVEENPHIVIDEDRNIILPERYKIIAAQGDHDMTTYTFDCPRFSDGRDMSKMVVYINYIRSDGETGSYPADNVSIDAQNNDLMHFEWTPLLPATIEHGAFAFLVCVCRTEPDGNMKNHWSTRLCKDATISEGMDCHQNTIIDMYPDVITRILERLNVLEDGGTTSVQYTVQDLEEEQKVQARKNIEAADAKEVSKLSEDIATKASAIKEKSSGELIVVTDSDERKPLGLAIDGKSEQNQYSGNQLIDISKVSKYPSTGYVANDTGSLIKVSDTISRGKIYYPIDISLLTGMEVKLSAKISKSISDVAIFVGAVITSPSGNTYHNLVTSDLSGVKTKTFVIPSDATSMNVDINVNDTGNTLSTANTVTVENLMLCLSSVTDDTFEPFVGGKPSPSTEYEQKIRNIGVYDEASGKYAVEVKCATEDGSKETTATVYLDEPLRKGDEAYWNGGSKIRVDRYRDVEVFDGSDDEKWTVQSTNTSGIYRVKSELLVGKTKPVGITIIGKHLCDSYVSVPSNTAGTFGCNSGLSIDDKGSVYVYDENFNTNDISLWKAHLAENPITVEYELAEPTTEEIDIDLGELSMFYPTTILSNDCNANMEVTYIADTKAYIDKKFAELATAMV